MIPGARTKNKMAVEEVDQQQKNFEGGSWQGQKYFLLWATVSLEKKTGHIH